MHDTKLISSPPPTFSHDDIIAATTFGDWESVLLGALSTDINAEKNSYLWPYSLTKVFRRLHLIDKKPDDARMKLINMLKEIRDYRNRIFHHDCIWIKSKTVDTQTAIDSIREKINLIEVIITALSPATIQALNIWGIFENTRRICSVSELSIYTDLRYQTPDIEKPGILKELYQQTHGGKSSVPMLLNNQACLLYRLR